MNFNDKKTRRIISIVVLVVIVAMVATMIILVNLLVDLLYGVVNPRIRHKK